MISHTQNTGSHYWDKKKSSSGFHEKRKKDSGCVVVANMEDIMSYYNSWHMENHFKDVSRRKVLILNYLISTKFFMAYKSHILLRGIPVCPHFICLP